MRITTTNFYEYLAAETTLNRECVEVIPGGNDPSRAQ